MGLAPWAQAWEAADTGGGDGPRRDTGGGDGPRRDTEGGDRRDTEGGVVGQRKRVAAQSRKAGKGKRATTKANVARPPLPIPPPLTEGAYGTIYNLLSII